MPPKAKATETNDDPFGTPDVTNDGDKWVITIKGGSGYDAPWLVGHLSSLDKVDESLSNRDLMDSVLTRLWETAQRFASNAPERPAAATKSNNGGAQRTPPNGPPPGTEIPDCEHGPMQYRTGIVKSGNRVGETWKAFMCPQPKGSDDQCKPQFIK